MKSIYKKLAVLALFLTLVLKVFAPTYRNGIIVESNTPVEPYINLIHAIGMVETQQDTLAYNPLEEAAGYFQIRPIRLMDYNIRTGNKYTMKDLFNYSISEKIFLYYASIIGPYDFERIARNWNGSGESTIFYWARVKQFLQ